jgi:hypothetical protein
MLLRFMRAACLVGILLALGEAAAEECRICHSREADAHARSAHANALKPVLQSLFYRSLPAGPIGEARGGFLLAYQPRGSVLEVTARRNGETALALIEWVFGAGRRAETPVALLGTRFLEHRISYYSRGSRFDLTMGHSAGISRSAGEALGAAQPREAIELCFACHGAGGMPGNAEFQAGVQCENCHAGARAHAERRGPVRNPARLEPKALVAFCARCHRDQPEGAPDDRINVRYQAVRLKRSKCFQTSGMSCLTCHDAHSDARQDAGWYRSRCLECHVNQQGRGDCLSCHMRRVAITARLLFTDHYIR